MKHSLIIDDEITYIGYEEDILFLRTKLFNVNMRLFATSFGYAQIISNICEHIKWLAVTEMEGYKKPHGMSGANAGIPFNIIGIVENRGKVGEYCRIMINPEILEYSKEMVQTSTNCGSIRLKKHINVLRADAVYVKYYTQKGEEERKWFTRKQGSFTIQHEIDHNLGILITDKEIKPNKNESKPGFYSLSD
jgi:peptide deformylase